jgi:hypothetical protein
MYRSGSPKSPRRGRAVSPRSPKRAASPDKSWGKWAASQAQWLKSQFGKQEDSDPIAMAEKRKVDRLDCISECDRKYGYPEQYLDDVRRGYQGRLNFGFKKSAKKVKKSAKKVKKSTKKVKKSKVKKSKRSVRKAKK